MEQNREPRTGPNLYSQLIFDKGVIWQKKGYFQQTVLELDIHMQSNLIITLSIFQTIKKTFFKFLKSCLLKHNLHSVKLTPNLTNAQSPP